MNRHVVAGMLGLALAGCAQNRSAMPSRGPGLGPVGMTSFPSIHDTINRENPNVDPAALRAESGMPGSQPGSSRIVYTPGQQPAAQPSRPPVAMAAASPAPETPGTAAPSAPRALESADRSQTAVASTGSPPGESPPAPEAPSSPPPPADAAASPAQALSSGLEADAMPASAPPPVVTEPAAPSLPPAADSPAAAPAAEAPVPPAQESPAPAAPPLADPAPVEPSSPTPATPAQESPAPAAPPAGSPAPGEPPPPATRAEPATQADPSIGAEPDAVPPIAIPTPSAGGDPKEPAPKAPEAGAPAPPAVPGDPGPTAPEAPPALPPADEAPPALPPADEAPPALPPADEAPPALPPSAEGAQPAPAAPETAPVEPSPAPPALPPAESAPPALPPLDGSSAPPTPAPPPPSGDPSVGAQPDAVPDVAMPRPAEAPAEPQAPPIPPALPPLELEPVKAEGANAGEKVSQSKHDPEVKATAADSTMVRSEIQPRKLQEAGSVAATVGDEVITMSEVRTAVRDQLKGVPAGQRPTEQEINMVASATLTELIERSVIVQEAKRQLKDPKKVQMFLDNADKIWREEELEPLLRRYTATNEYQLKERMADRGLSLDQVREAYRRQFLSHQFLRSKLSSKLSISFPEMRDYYNEHLHDYDRPAQVTWREVVVETDKSASRAQARAKADAALARLRRGEDFAAVAKAMSDGPNKGDGGRWETSPGGYAVEAVNQAIESMPMGQISQVIEGPSSYHIVRVEGRRAAGPAPFSEVQDKVKKSIYEQKTREAMSTYINKLRSQTLISSVLDRAQNDPVPPGGPAR